MALQLTVDAEFVGDTLQGASRQPRRVVPAGARHLDRVPAGANHDRRQRFAVLVAHGAIDDLRHIAVDQHEGAGQVAEGIGDLLRPRMGVHHRGQHLVGTEADDSEDRHGDQHFQ